MELFETHDLLAHLVPGLLLKFLTAVLCGGSIGMEREVGGKPAGLRTCILICVGATLFTFVSFEMARIFGGDATRIAAQIVTGIGFLGAGAILHQPGGGIGGMTTAAMIWLLAALGMMIGSGLVVLALSITVATVLMILLLKKVEERVHKKAARAFKFRLPNTPATRRTLAELSELYEEALVDYKMEPVPENPEQLILSFRFLGPNDVRRELVRHLFELPELEKLYVEPAHTLLSRITS